MATTCDSCKKVIHANGPDVLAICWECLENTNDDPSYNCPWCMRAFGRYSDLLRHQHRECHRPTLVDDISPPSPLDNCEYIEATRLSPYLY